jgi:hypothetical protein
MCVDLEFDAIKSRQKVVKGRKVIYNTVSTFRKRLFTTEYLNCILIVISVEEIVETYFIK